MPASNITAQSCIVVPTSAIVLSCPGNPLDMASRSVKRNRHVEVVTGRGCTEKNEAPQFNIRGASFACENGQPFSPRLVLLGYLS
jgi:hypothetical protein